MVSVSTNIPCVRLVQFLFSFGLGMMPQKISGAFSATKIIYHSLKRELVYFLLGLFWATYQHEALKWWNDTYYCWKYQVLCRFTVSLFDGVADISPTQHFWRGTAIVLWEVCISNAYFRIPKKTPHNTLAPYNVSFMWLYPTVTATGKENILPINIKAEHFISDLLL